MTDLRATLRRKDIMRSGLCPPVGLASGVMRLLLCERQLARTSYCLQLALQSRTDVLRASQGGTGSLSRGIRRSVFGTRSAT